MRPDSIDDRSSKSFLENYFMVDLPNEPRPVTPKTASIRLAILLFRRLIIFVAVVIITITLSKHGDLPDIQCKIGVVGQAPGNMMMTGAGGPHPIYGPIYEYVIENIIRVPLPTALMSMFRPCD
jgi:hypothetical protein